MITHKSSPWFNNGSQYQPQVAQDVVILDGSGLIIGHTSQVTIETVIPELQLLGTEAADTQFLMHRASADDSAATIVFAKGRDAIGGFDTIVSDDDRVGEIRWYAADGDSFDTRVASFQAEVDDADPAVGDIGMAFVWKQMPGGGGGIAETMRLSAAGDLSLQAAAKLYLDGGTHTYIHESSDDVLAAVIGGDTKLSSTATITTFTPATNMRVAFANRTIEFDYSGSSAVPGSGGTILRLTQDDGAATGSGHSLGVMEFRGAEDVSSTIKVGAKIEVITDELWSPTENGAYMVFSTNDADNSLTEKWRITSEGVFSSNATQPSNAATTDGGILATGGVAFTDVANAWIDDAAHGDGTVTHYIGQDSIDVTDLSDIRMKHNIENFDDSVMEKIKRFDFITYDREARERRKFGLSAQAVQDIFPEYVSTRSDGYLQIKYNEMTPVAFRGLQEHETRVADLERELAGLKAMIGEP